MFSVWEGFVITCPNNRIKNWINHSWAVEPPDWCSHPKSRMRQKYPCISVLSARELWPSIMRLFFTFLLLLRRKGFYVLSPFLSYSTPLSWSSAWIFDFHSKSKIQKTPPQYILYVFFTKSFYYLHIPLYYKNYNLFKIKRHVLNKL